MCMCVGVCVYVCSRDTFLCNLLSARICPFAALLLLSLLLSLLLPPAPEEGTLASTSAAEPSNADVVAVMQKWHLES